MIRGFFALLALLVLAGETVYVLLLVDFYVINHNIERREFDLGYYNLLFAGLYFTFLVVCFFMPAVSWLKLITRWSQPFLVPTCVR